MKTLYLIGPVTGIENDNRLAFEAARSSLLMVGYAAAIPHDIIASGTPWHEAMNASISEMTRCFDGEPLYDGVAMMPGCEGSRGACIERDLAVALGMTVKTVDEWIEAANA